jgi:hypothetical protein
MGKLHLSHPPQGVSSVKSEDQIGKKQGPKPLFLWRRDSTAVSLPTMQVSSGRSIWTVRASDCESNRTYPGSIVGRGRFLFRAVHHTVTSKCRAYFSTGRRDGDGQSRVPGATKAIRYLESDVGRAAGRGRCAGDIPGRRVKRYPCRQSPRLY